ncbi:MAG: PBP1A family penicillin-binding protein [Nitrospirae bacterium]|nr:MAG: PBP1A family penicillin-binding protein [Nitrospirota bacterium]
MATEDSRFFRHRGIDYIGVARALVRDILSMSFREGGSTITQQLAKLLFLGHEKTLTRKIKEAVIAIVLEKRLTKEEILELYLNRAYFGSGAYGVEMASKKYFGKSAQRLSPKEAAMIAGLLKAPNRYSPFRDVQRAEQRARVVLRRMEDEGYLKPSERKLAEKEPLRLRPTRFGDEPYGYFTSIVRDYLEDRYGPEAVNAGGLRVYTTVRRWAQIKGVETLKDALEKYDKIRGWRGPSGHIDNISVQKELKRLAPGDVLKEFEGKVLRATVLRVTPEKAILSVNGAYAVLKKQNARWAKLRYDGKRNITVRSKRFDLNKILSVGDQVLVRVERISGGVVYTSLEQLPEVQGALVSINPSNGEVEALVGGYDYKLSPFNRAVYAKRQAGSAFKPFVYALSLQKGYTAVATLRDEPVVFPVKNGKTWRPLNYDRKYRGKVSLRDALTYSLNVPTVNLAKAVGLDEIVKFAGKVGLKPPKKPDLSMVLGSLVVSPLSLTAAYTIFANGGEYHPPIIIRRVTDSKGKVLEEHYSQPRRVVSRGVSFIITDILRDVIRRGTGRRAGGLPIDVAGKTGTTDDYRDAWFVGYSTELLTGVWVGYDDGRSLGEGMSGGRLAAPIWREFMRKVSGKGVKGFTVPSDVKEVVVSRKTGKRVLFKSGSSYREYFIRGTEPEWGGLR